MIYHVFGDLGWMFRFLSGPFVLPYTVKKNSVTFTVKNWQLWLPEFYRKKYGNNILGFTVLT